MSAELKGTEKIFNRLKRLKKRAKDVERPLKEASVYMLGSIDKNFQSEGRPTRWTELAESTKKRRRGKRSKILTDTAKLRRSMNYRITTDGVEIGTNAIQAARQHFGYPGGEGPGQAETPARPFLMFQDEDIEEIGNIFSRHIRS